MAERTYAIQGSRPQKGAAFGEARSEQFAPARV
jgi:hypothetical protein